MPAVRALLTPLVALMVPAAPLSAQRVDPDRHWDTDQWQHAASGAAIDLSLRGPWLAPSWQRWYLRVAITTGIGVGYELAQSVHDDDAGLDGLGYGFGVLDIVADAAGALAAEAATALLGRLVGGRARTGSPPPVAAVPPTDASSGAIFDWPSPLPPRATRRVSIQGGFAIPF